VTIGSQPPHAVATLLTRQPLTGAVTAFDGTASSDSDGQIVAYDWDFGDGTSTVAPRPSHTYRAPGLYRVTLTVVSSDGTRATTTISFSVLAPGRITHVQARQGSSGPTVIVSVNGPGRLRVGSHTVTVHGAGAAFVQLRCTTAQLRALAAHRTVRIKTAIAFHPTAGPASHRTYTITLHQPANSRHYTVALRPQS
jgi:hypothetical protein